MGSVLYSKGFIYVSKGNWNSSINKKVKQVQIESIYIFFSLSPYSRKKKQKQKKTEPHFHCGLRSKPKQEQAAICVLPRGSKQSL